jgi:adenylate kinase family enzyme
VSEKIIQKIIITGDAARGKSTLASKLAQKLGIPYFSTDDFYYEVKFTKMRSKEDSSREISKVYRGDKWIVEGATEHMIEPGLPFADLVICLKHNNLFAQWTYLVKRHFSSDNETTGDLFEFMRHVFYKRYSIGYRKGQPTIHEFISPYKEKVVTLSSFKEMEDFFNYL